MARFITRVATSVRQRLLNLSQARGVDYNALLIQYGIERFLFRLSKSRHSRRFVLKGAMLMRVWSEDIYRPTKDVDLLGFGDPSPAAVAAAVREIIAVAVPDDGLQFESASISTGLIREDQQYNGVRAKIEAMLGSARLRLQIDVGFGDSVVPEPQHAIFPTLLGPEGPTLLVYPVETVIAEKLEAIVNLGVANTRMKDYYDLLVILRRFAVAEPLLARAIAATFQRRRTTIPQGTPTGLSAVFTRDPEVQKLWRAFLDRLRIKDVPTEFSEVAAVIGAGVAPALMRARNAAESANGT